MNNQNIIVYRFNYLYQILKELEEDINFKIIEISDEKTLKNEIENLNNYLIITKKQILKLNNQFVLSQLPIKIFKMIEKLNIEFLKHQFVEQSRVIINDYIIEVTKRHPDKVKEYREGKKGLIGFFMGEVMKLSKGNADPKLANKLLQEKLDK